MYVSVTIVRPYFVTRSAYDSYTERDKELKKPRAPPTTKSQDGGGRREEWTSVYSTRGGWNCKGSRDGFGEGGVPSHPNLGPNLSGVMSCRGGIQVVNVCKREANFGG